MHTYTDIWPTYLKSPVDSQKDRRKIQTDSRKQSQQWQCRYLDKLSRGDSFKKSEKDLFLWFFQHYHFEKYFGWTSSGVITEYEYKWLARQELSYRVEENPFKALLWNLLRVNGNAVLFSGIIILVDVVRTMRGPNLLKNASAPPPPLNLTPIQKIENHKKTKLTRDCHSEVRWNTNFHIFPLEGVFRFRTWRQWSRKFLSRMF